MEWAFTAYHQHAASFASLLADIAGRAVIYGAVGRLMHGLSLPLVLIVVGMAIAIMWFTSRRQW